VIGLVQVGDAAMADRYAYIPLIGVFVMLAFGTADLLQASPIGTVWRAVPAVAILIVLALLTHRQIDYWSSSYTLWAHTLAVTQNNFVAEDNLGGALLSEGRPDEAFQHFEAALRINPYEPMSRTNIGTYLQTHGRIAEAIAQYDSALALTSDAGLRAQVYANLGAARRELGEDDLALQNFDKALQLNPNQANAWLGMGLLAQKQGRFDEAIVDFSRSINLQPTGEAWLDLGRSLQQTGRTPEALDAYRRALQVSPGLAEAQRAMESLTAARQ